MSIRPKSAPATAESSERPRFVIFSVPKPTVLRLPQVKAKTGLGRSTIYSQMASGCFPLSFSLGARAVGWIEGEVDAVIAARIGGASDAQIRILVADLVAARGRGQVQ